jgi:hypothetical protein
LKQKVVRKNIEKYLTDAQGGANKMDYQSNVVRDPSGRQVLDEIREPLFDTVTQPAGESPIKDRTFFQTVPLSPALGNLTQAGQLDGQTSFICLGLSLEAQNWEEVNRRVLPLMMNRSSITFKVGDKFYWKGKAYAACGKMSQVSSISTDGNAAPATAERVYQQYGDISTQPLKFAASHVVVLLPSQGFRVDFNTASGSMSAGEIAAATPTTFDVQYAVFLKGLRRRLA